MTATASTAPVRNGSNCVSVVVPVYQNAASLRDLHARLSSVATALDADSEFVFVDDGSTDGSAAALQKLQHADPRVRIVCLAGNFGSYAAVLAGLSQARGDAAAVISADLQDPPEVLVPLVTHWQQGSNLVLAARSKRDDPWPARFGAAAFYWLLRRLALSEMPPGGFDCCLLDRQAVDRLLTSKRIVFLPGDILRLGFTPTVIDYERGPRLAKYGPSAWTLAKRLRLACRVIWEYSRTPNERIEARPRFVIERVIEPAVPATHGEAAS